MDGSSIFFDAGIKIEDLLEFAGIMDLLNQLGKPQHWAPQRGAAEPMQSDRPLTQAPQQHTDRCISDMGGSSINFYAGMEETNEHFHLLIHQGDPQGGAAEPKHGDGPPAESLPPAVDDHLLGLASHVASVSVKINYNSVFNPTWVAAETAALGLGGGGGGRASLGMALSNLGLLAVGMVLVVILAAAVGGDPNRKTRAHRHPRLLLSAATGLLVLSLVLVGLRVVSASRPLPRLIRRAMIKKK